MSVPGSIASAGNGRKEGRRRMDGREEEGKNGRSDGGRKEWILDDLTGLIILLFQKVALPRVLSHQRPPATPSGPDGLSSPQSQNRRLLSSCHGPSDLVL